MVLLAVAWISSAAADASLADSVSGATVSCQTDEEGCSLDVHAAMRAVAPGSGHSGPPQTTSEQQFYRWLVACRLGFHSAANLPHPAGSGSWYLAPCVGTLGIVNPTGSPLMWIPDGAHSVAVLALAHTAEQNLKLPLPAMMSSPGTGGNTPKVVNLPTWAWVPQAQWVPVSATASVPGVSVTARATPQYVEWSWGDGSFSACQGPGAAYTPGASDPAAASPDCGHTYTQTSKNGASLCFSVTATIHWRITWQATTGQAGQFPDMTSRAAQAWPVEEIDALNIPGNQAL